MRKLILVGWVVLAPTWCLSATQIELDASRDKAVAWLVRAQQPDGRWSSARGLDVHTTAAAVEALAVAGFTRLPAFASGVAWLQNAEAGSTDALARQVIALRLAGSTVASTRLAARLNNQRNADDKGWGAYPGYLASIPDTPMALLALKAEGLSVTDTAAVATAFDASRYGVAGQKFWLHRLTAEATKAEGSGEQIIPTALSMLALKSYALSTTSLAEAVTFLKARQASSGINQGGFAGVDGVYNPMDAALAGEALAVNSASGRADVAVQAALDFLKRTQAINGSWSDSLTTASALRFIGASSTAVVDTDGDGIPDSVEAHLGTNSLRADSKQLLLTNVGANAPADGDMAFFSAWALRGKPMVHQFSIADALTCCTNLSGALPSGLTLTTSGSPLTVKVSGTPTNAGPFDSHWSYKTAAGLERRFEFRLEVDPTLFVADNDPFVLAALFADVELNKVKGGWQAAVDDFNGDGRPDMLTYFSGANEWFNRLNCSPCAPYAGPDWGQVVGFQDVNGSLARATPLIASVKFTGDVRNIYVVDFNNDGKRDVVLNLNKVVTTSVDPTFKSTLPFRALVALRNDTADGGLLTFTDVTTTLKLETAPEGDLVVLDVNRDGFADHVVSNGAAVGKLYVYNTTLGTYEDKTATSGFGVLTKPVAVDFDGDNLIDLVSRDSTTGIKFFRNKGDGTFVAVANETSLVGLASRTINRIVPADLNNDGKPELVIFETATIGAGSSQAYAGNRVTVLNHGGLNASLQPKFTERSASTLTDISSLADAVGLGGSVSDLDDDGLLDIVVAARDVSSSQIENAVFKQQSDGSFVKLVAESGLTPGLTAFDAPVPVDLNGDNKLDLIWPNSSNAGYRLLNAGNENHALDIVLKGKSTNKGALGATVQVAALGVTQSRQILSLHATPTNLHFGLGVAEAATVTVKWPDGTSQTIDVTSVDRIVTVTQP